MDQELVKSKSRKYLGAIGDRIETVAEAGGAVPPPPAGGAAAALRQRLWAFVSAYTGVVGDGVEGVGRRGARGLNRHLSISCCCRMREGRVSMQEQRVLHRCTCPHAIAADLVRREQPGWGEAGEAVH